MRGHCAAVIRGFFILKKSAFIFAATGLLAVLLSACSPVGMASSLGASVGIATAQEGGIKGAIKDSTIELNIAEAWMKYNFDMYRKLAMTVKEGRVLITGSVPNPDMRVEAVRLAWQTDGVRQVLNEISVDNGSGISGIIKDTVITNSIKAKLVLDKNIQSINYNVETANGNVYLMGIARDQMELDRVIDYARNSSNVNNVINYVRMQGQHLPEDENAVKSEKLETPETN